MFCWPCISIHPCNENQHMHYLSSAYFVNQPLHVSDIFVAHHQEVWCIYATIGTCCVFQQTINWKTQHVPIVVYTVYIILPDDGLQICPKHLEVDWRNKLRINSASSWFSLHVQIFSYCPFFVFPSPLSLNSTFSTVTSSFPSRFLSFSFPFSMSTFLAVTFSACTSLPSLCFLPSSISVHFCHRNEFL